MPASLESGKELLGPRNTAKGDHRALNRRNLHAPPQPPHRPLPAPCAEFVFQTAILRRNRQHCRPHGRMQRFAQVSSWKQPIAPVVPVQQQDIDVSVKLAVLESIVQDVNATPVRRRVHLRQQTAVIPLPRDIHRNAGLPRNEQRLVPELLCRTVHPYSRRSR